MDTDTFFRLLKRETDGESPNGKITKEQLAWFLRLSPKTRDWLCDGTIVNHTIPINRRDLFDPAKFLGRGWVVDEQDRRSLEITEISLADIRLETMLKPDEVSISGYERIKRLKQADYIRLDAKIFADLLANPLLIPDFWREQEYIPFDGTIIVELGELYIIGLWWDNDYHQWSWCVTALSKDDLGPNVSSAVL